MKVLFSPTRSGAGGNPYVEHLVSGLEAAGVEVAGYQRRAILSRPDVVHVNWPAFVVDWSSRRVAVSEAVRTLAFLAVARARGTRIVWTAHDLGAHDRPLPRLQRLYERAFSALATDVVSLSAAAVPLLRQRFPQARRARFHVVPHGHYRDDYPRVTTDRLQARAELGLPEDGRVVLQFGMLRRYKAIESMIRSFGALEEADDVRLLVVGESRDPGYTLELEAAARATPRVTLRTERVDERTAALLMTAADVVYAAYPPGTSLNSGVAVLGLSFDRPVVVRDTPVMQELRNLAGPEWVHPATPGGDPAALRAALAASGRNRGRQVDLSALDWDGIVAAMIAVYEGRAEAVDRRDDDRVAPGSDRPRESTRRAHGAGGRRQAPTGVRR